MTNKILHEQYLINKQLNNMPFKFNDNTKHSCVCICICPSVSIIMCVCATIQCIIISLFLHHLLDIQTTSSPTPNSFLDFAAIFTNSTLSLIRIIQKYNAVEMHFFMSVAVSLLYVYTHTILGFHDLLTTHSRYTTPCLHSE